MITENCAGCVYWRGNEDIFQPCEINKLKPELLKVYPEQWVCLDKISKIRKDCDDIQKP